MTNSELLNHLENFHKAHTKAVRAYCKKHKIDLKEVKGVSDESYSIKYHHNNRVIVSARMIPTMKFEIKMKNNG